MTTAVTIVFCTAAVLLILIVLLQAGKGGGMGAALGGGATQSVFGGSGGADFLAKATYGLAAAFMISAVYLAWASAHTGSSRLQSESQTLAQDEYLANEGEDVNYERIGPNPLPLPSSNSPEQAPAGSEDADTPEPDEPDEPNEPDESDDEAPPPEEERVPPPAPDDDPA